MEEFEELSTLGHTELAELSAADPPKVPIPEFNLEILLLDPEDPSDSQWEAQDDVHSGALPPGLVRAARQKEIQFLKDRKVYSLSITAEAFRLTRRLSLKLKWMDTNKGDERLFNEARMH